MKETNLTKAVTELVEIKLKALDVLIKELVEPLADVGSPEKVLGKKYEDWIEEDFLKASQIYGKNEPNALSDLIARKEITKVKEMEKEIL